MCFRFDGDRRLAAYRPDGCSESQLARERQGLAVAAGNASFSNGAARAAPSLDCGSETSLTLVMNLLQSVDRRRDAFMPGLQL